MLSHPRDVAAFALRHSGTGSALVFVTAVAGGSVRAPGLRMAVSAEGETIGFVSNGCVEADLTAVARDAIREGRYIETAYGRGSGKIDIVLPCGGRVDLAIVPVGPKNVAALEALIASGRQSGELTVSADGHLAWTAASTPVPSSDYRFTIHPKIRLIVAGVGTEALLLARLAAVADMEVEVLSPDEPTLARARALGLRVQAIRGLSSTVELAADSLTALALMFHDHEWEARLLTQAIKGPAFYVGALGSRRAHENRVATLAQLGCSAGDIARIKAPIGMVHQLREPNLLAASVLAEISAEFKSAFGQF